MTLVIPASSTNLIDVSSLCGDTVTEEAKMDICTLIWVVSPVAIGQLYLWLRSRWVDRVFEGGGRRQREDGFAFRYSRWGVPCSCGGMKSDERSWS
jgi:hypothetical protein